MCGNARRSLTELYEWYGDRHNRILVIYEEAMQTSTEIHGAEIGEARAVPKEKIQTAKKVATAAITAAQTKFLPCSLAAALPVE